MTPARRLTYHKYTFKQLMELDACTRCGECITWCPTYTEKRLEAITPLAKIAQLRRFAACEHGLVARLFGLRPIPTNELNVHSQGVYDCTLCGRCHEVCPVQIDTRPLWLSMREQLVDSNAYPSSMQEMRERIASTHNNLGEPNANRLSWAENLDRQPPAMQNGQQIEVVYFVGCVSAFFPMAFSIPQSLSMILEKAGVSAGVMGSEEWCCGFPLIIAGMARDAEDLARHNVEAVRASGAKFLLTSCPSCYHTWKHTYPEVIGEGLGFQVMHAVELLDTYIAEGRLKLGSYERQVTYHDPCDLGRNSRIYEAPRRVLCAIPGLTLVEMADHRERSLCCGGGGDVEMADPDLTGAVARTRLQQAQATGSEAIVSACQQCKRTLMGAARKEKIRLRTLDITEIVWEAMQAT